MVWAKLNHNTPKAKEDIANQIIWYNTHVKIAGKVCFKKALYEKGIIYVKDLCPNGAFYTYQQFVQIFGTGVSLMEYNSVIAAIPATWKKTIKNSRDLINLDNCTVLDKYSSKTKWANFAYHELLNGDITLFKRLASVWTKKINSRVDVDEINQAFENINGITSITKYRAFQYRLLHNAVLVNDRLIYAGVVNTKICDFCKKEKIR